MSYEKQCQELDVKIKRIQQIGSSDCYIQDGIVNIENWRKQQIRPLFIGKEAYYNGENTNWAIKNWLDDTPEDACRASPRTWQTTAYTSFGLQHGFENYSSIPWPHEDTRVIDALRTIAFINVGKLGGDTTTSWNRLDTLYRQNALILHDQIEFYQPNVIIGWSTLDFFEKDEAFKSRFAKDQIDKMNFGAVDYWLTNGKIFIDAYHPAYLGVTQSNYVDSIIGTVKNNFHEINTKLPAL